MSDFTHIPLDQVRTILTDWCKSVFDFSDEEIDVIVTNTGNLIRSEGFEKGYWAATYNPGGGNPYKIGVQRGHKA